MNTTCRMPAMPRPVTVHDVSAIGCRLELHGTPIEPGSTAIFELPGKRRVAGVIVWSDGCLAGVRFERPLGRAAAGAFGLEQPEPEPGPEPIRTASVVPDAPQGLLNHWFRRLTRRFA